MLVGFVAVGGRRKPLWQGGLVAELRRVALTPEKVLDAALAIIEAEGVDAFTMRRLADELGVRTPTVYWHVGSRQNILERLIERISVDLGLIRPRGSTPQARITSVCVTLLREVRRRPYIVTISRTAGRGEAVFVRVQELLAREVLATGLHGADAAFALRTILYQLGGFLVVNHDVDEGGRIRGVDQWTVDDAALLDAAREPFDFDEIVRYSLEAILDRLLPR